MFPFSLPSPLPPSAPSGPVSYNFTNSLMFTDHYTQNGRFGSFINTFGLRQRFDGQQAFIRSWTNTLAFTSTFGPTTIIGSWTNNLTFSGTYPDGPNTLNNSFTNTLTFSSHFLTVPIIGLITTTLTFTNQFPHNSIYSRLISQKLTFTSGFVSTNNITSNIQTETLSFIDRFSGTKYIAPTHFTNTLNFHDLYPPAYTVRSWTNTLTFSGTYSGKRNVLGSWSNQMTFTGSFPWSINPSRSWTDNLVFSGYFSGAILQSAFIIRYGDMILKLPQPELGDRVKPIITMNKLISMNGTTRTYLKRPGKKSWLFEFIIDQKFKTQIKSFFDLNFDKLLIVQWLGETIQVNLTSNPIIFETTTRYRMKFSLQFEGATDGSWLTSNCIGNGF
jgi:hypothetical protein